ncbi:AP-5 complex subunit beta-1 isoform X1 [Stigmatopora nigra]
MEINWMAKISDFFRSPPHFISSKSAENFLAELLWELRDDKFTDTTKVYLLSSLCDQPTLLCPTVRVAEDTVMELLSVFAHCSNTSVQFRSSLLITLTSVLICTCCVSSKTYIYMECLNLLIQILQDTSDLHHDNFLLRATACECLQELEMCYPTLLSHILEFIGGLWAREISRLHQPYARLHIAVLKNCVYLLALDPGLGDDMKVLLGENTFVNWEADRGSVQIDKDSAILSSFLKAHLVTVPILQTGRDCKDLRSVLSTTLENSFLLTPLCQAAVLQQLMEVVAMVPAVPPSIFRGQLLRMLGSGKVCLLHSTLQMKCAYTDSLFTTDDEVLMLRRLVVLAQHPLLSTPENLFFMDYILHFPENRPINFENGNESSPVLLTTQLAFTLVPTVLNDYATMLARFNLLFLVYQEEGEKEGDDGKGILFLYEHISLLFDIVVKGQTRELVATFFRVVFLFLIYFCHLKVYSNNIADKLCMLYCQKSHLAPQILNLADQASDMFPECNWASGLCRALQDIITVVPPAHFTLADLIWHLKVLTRVAEEEDIPQMSTLRLLSNIVIMPPLSISTDWRLGNIVLGLCRRLMTHPNLYMLFMSLTNILQHLIFCYGDADIQDHARLYYSVLISLSKEKMAEILTRNLIDDDQNAKHSSCIMADTERLTSMLTIHRTEKTVLKLVEVKYSESQTMNKRSLESYKYPTEEQDLPELEAYKAQFKNSFFGSHITLYYQVNQSMCNLSCFNEVFSIHLQFTSQDNNYDKLSDINVPCLFREKAFPVVKLGLKPKLPFPTTLRCSAIFSALNGLTLYTILPDILVFFRQTFQPLAVPTTWRPNAKLHIFEGLWQEIIEEQADNCSTLFCRQLQTGEWVSLVEKHLFPFFVSGSTNESVLKLIFFISPKFHILLKIISEEDAVHFNIATDKCQLLPCFTSFLCNLLTNLPENQ